MAAVARAARRAAALRRASTGLRAMGAFKESGRLYNEGFEDGSAEDTHEDEDKGADEKTELVDDDGVPLGWHIRRDEDGRPYYVSADPRVPSTYDVPEDLGAHFSQPTSTKPEAEENEAAPEEEGNGGDGEAFSPFFPWTEEADEGSGQPYWLNNETKVTTWDRPQPV